MTVSPLLLFSLSRWLFPTFGIDSAYWVYPYKHVGVALHTPVLQYSLMWALLVSVRLSMKVASLSIYAFTDGPMRSGQKGRITSNVGVCMISVFPFPGGASRRIFWKAGTFTHSFLVFNILSLPLVHGSPGS